MFQGQIGKIAPEKSGIFQVWAYFSTCLPSKSGLPTPIKIILFDSYHFQSVVFYRDNCNFWKHFRIECLWYRFVIEWQKALGD